MNQRIIPEPDVSDLNRSLDFYVRVVGCKVLYERPEERFAFLELEGAEFMSEEEKGLGRRFCTASLEKPYGHGINFQIQVSNVDALYKRVREAGFEPIIQLEERWHRNNDMELGNRQFVVPDPDGFLMRFFTDLGKRPAARPNFP
jgi:catechol 2,3-dioxygenase-like lactoylglutathione lyase family enzyme